MTERLSGARKGTLAPQIDLIWTAFLAKICTAVDVQNGGRGWFARELPGEPVALFTQTANARSMRLAAKLGFTEVERFEAYGAEQWFGMWSPGHPPD